MTAWSELAAVVHLPAVLLARWARASLSSIFLASSPTQVGAELLLWTPTTPELAVVRQALFAVPVARRGVVVRAGADDGTTVARRAFLRSAVVCGRPLSARAASMQVLT